MATTDPDAGPLLIADDFTATSEGRWHVVRLKGRVIARRYTRDEAFTSVWIRFKDGRSPAYPKTEANLETRWNGDRHIVRVEWRGPWMYRGGFNRGPNRLEIPIRRAEPPND